MLSMVYGFCFAFEHGHETISFMEILVQNSQNFLDFFHRPAFQKTRRFGNWVCFLPHVKVGEKTPTQLGPLEKANLNHQ
jgi:hypothetical protein